jgi:hypothetical protein
MLTFTGPYSFISQTIELFITTAAKFSNPNFEYMFKNTACYRDNGKAIPVTGREGTKGFETSRFPYFL